MQPFPFRKLVFVWLTVAIASAWARAGDWPQFRGLDTLSYTNEKGLPTEWGGASEKNIVWKTPLPKADNGFSSPIVCNGRIFLSSVTNRPLTHTVLCFNEADGKPLWQTDVAPGPWKLGDLRAGYGASTPAATRDKVLVFFGSAVLACLDYDGKILWRKELKNTSFDVGIGTSPVVFDDSFVLQMDQNGNKSVLQALDPKTGEVKWETLRKESIFSHASPIIARVNGKPILVLSGSSTLAGFDPATGAKIWSIPSEGETPSPGFGEGLVYVDTGRGGGGVCADITGEQPVVKWKSARSEMGEGFSSPVIVDGMVYKSHHNDTLLCRKAATGEIVFSEHLKQLSTWSSPIVTGDPLLYFVSAGKSYVIRPGPKLDIVAVNDLDDPDPAPSAAVANGKIYIRGVKFLYCIANH